MILIILLNTRDFGEIEIEESQIISFPRGILSFEYCTSFALLRPFDNHSDDDTPVWFQYDKETNPCFITFDINKIITGYNPEPLKSDLDTIKYNHTDNLIYYAIAVVSENLDDEISKITLNLKSPLIVNPNSNLGVQAILPQNYDLRYVIHSLDKSRNNVIAKEDE